MINQMVDLFRQATSSWFAELLPIAQNVFLVLATITMIWSALWWILERDDPSQVYVAFLRRFFALGFFWAVLLNADTWIPAVIDGFAVAGQRAAGAASGGTPRLNPGEVLDQGVTIAVQAFHGAKVSGILETIGTAIVSAIGAFLILLAFVGITAQLVITLVEMYIVIGAGVLLLAFAASPWTLSFAERYFSYAVAVGIKLFVLYLIVGLGSAIVTGWQGTLAQTNASIDALLAVAGSALVYMLLAWQVPSLAASLIGGGLALSLGDTLRTGAAVAGLTAGAAGAAVGGLALGARGTAAMGEAVRTARAHRATGGSLAGSVARGGRAAAGGMAESLRRRALRPPWQTVSEVMRERRTASYGAGAGRSRGWGSSSHSASASRVGTATAPAPATEGPTSNEEKRRRA